MRIEFVSDGQERAYDASIDRVRTEVEQEFAERLTAAGFWMRLIVRFQMSREIDRRMEKIAPPWGLYSSTDANQPEA